jgi:hypothetical protein
VLRETEKRSLSLVEVIVKTGNVPVQNSAPGYGGVWGSGSVTPPDLSLGAR